MIKFVAFFLMFLSIAGMAETQQTDIPPNSTLYIAPVENGFHIDVAGAMRNKGVRLIIVNDESKADYRMDVTAENKKPGAARVIFLGQWSEGTASASVTNIKTGVVRLGLVSQARRALARDDRSFMSLGMTIMKVGGGAREMLRG